MKDRKMGRSKPSQASNSSNHSNSSTTSSVSSVSASSKGKVGPTIGKELPAEVKIKEMLSELRSMISDVQEEKDKNEQTLVNISKLQEKLALERSRSTSALIQQKSKLVSMYGTAYNEAESEYDVIKKALDQIKEIKLCREKGSDKPKQVLRRGVLMSLLQQNAMTLPLWIGKPGEEAPPLCGAIQAEQHHICESGDKVSARVKSAEDAEENWILAEVVSFNSVAGRYDVDDIDAEEGKERHSLSKRRITPLPKWKADPETNPEALFAKSALVLALYPQTTCFYRALVHIPPSKVSEDYSVLFEDITYPNGYSPPLNVSQRYVIVCKDDTQK